MLGAAPTDFLTPATRCSKQLADEMGKPEAFEKPHVAVYFGEPGKTVPDPYFGGEGPERTGCNRCGGCMTGCRFGAKNTLDKNYLYFARKRGLAAARRHRGHCRAPLAGRRLPRRGSRPAPPSVRKRARIQRASNVIFSGGVLGTELAAARGCKHDPTACRTCPSSVGAARAHQLRVADRRHGPGHDQDDHSKGIAISSILQTDEHSHLEPVRYGGGLGLLPHDRHGAARRRRSAASC